MRDKLDDSLIRITNIFIKNNIPITHAVEPANLTQEVVDFLLNTKREYPNLIEIIQHGYNHKLNYKEFIGGKLRKGEFGGKRTYEDQYKDIKAGKNLMDKYFGDMWFPVFTFPYGARNNAVIKAVNDVGFKVVNGGISPYFKHRIFYKIGRLLKKECLLNRKVSWNLKYKPNTNLFQIDLGISIIKKYNDERTACEMYTLDELKKLTINNLKILNIGLLIHHRYHNTEEKLMLVEDYLSWIKQLPNIEFSTQEQIFRIFA